MTDATTQTRHSSELATPPGVASSAADRNQRASHAIFWCVIALVSALCVFVLPFLLPPKIPTFSDSYQYGFNNRIAELSAAIASAVVTLILWARQMGRPPKEACKDQRMPRRWLAIGALCAVCFTAGLGAAMIRSNIAYSDAGFFMAQIHRVVHDRAVLYRDVEFPYGPIMMYWPALTQRAFALIGLSPAVAYVFTLGLMQVVGLVFLYYILEWLPLSKPTRKLFFGLCAFATLPPLLGLNYTLLRFLLPHALFLAITRQRSVTLEAVLLGFGQLLAMGFSPEIGVSFLGGAIAYAFYRCYVSGPSWLAAVASPFLASLIFSSLAGRSYYAMMSRFAFGAFNVIVAPDFHILVLLTAAIALCPIAVAGFLQTKDPRAGVILGFYVISLGMLGPALGRCDSLHTFFGGLGIYLLSLLAVDGLLTRSAKLWIFALSAAIVFSQVEDFYFYRWLVARVVFLGPNSQDGVDLNRLETLTHGERIAAPITIPLHVSQELNRRNELQPSYFYFMDCWDDADERKKIEELRQAPFALIPNSKYQVTDDDVDQSRVIPLLHTPIHYPRRFKPWVQGALLAKELRDYWTPVGSVGRFTVYRQNGR